MQSGHNKALLSDKFYAALQISRRTRRYGYVYEKDHQES